MHSFKGKRRTGENTKELKHMEIIRAGMQEAGPGGGSGAAAVAGPRAG